MQAKWSLLGLGFAITAGALTSAAGESWSAEAARSFYLLGQRSQMSGVVPPPGVYASNIFYIYDGEAAGGTDIPIAGEIVSGADSTLITAQPAATFVFPNEVLGGSFGITGSLMLGWEELVASAAFDNPAAPPIKTDIEDAEFDIGDPAIGALLGWHSGDLHWNVATMLNIPVGSWQEGRLANIGLNRWAVDFTGSVTWLDLSTLWEASAAAGFTFNGKNRDLDYTTGTEFHAEAEVSKLFANGLSLGVAGYYYKQVTGDHGEDALLGSFKGEVAAIGPLIGATLPFAHRDLSLKAQWYHEFEAQNRLEGDAFFITGVLPLQKQPKPRN